MKARLLETVRYLVAGGIGLGLYYLLLYTLTEYLNWWYVLSASIATIVNFTSNFLLKKFWAFKDTNRNNIRSQAVHYAILWIALGIANVVLLYVFTTYGKLWYMHAQMLTTIILTAIGYGIAKKIFQKEKL